LRILDNHANILEKEVSNLVNCLFKPINNARDNTSPSEYCEAQIDRANVRENKSVQNLQTCEADVRRELKNEISV